MGQNRSKELITKINSLPDGGFSTKDIPGLNKGTLGLYLKELVELGYIEKLPGRVIGEAFQYRILKPIPEDLVLKGKGLRPTKPASRKPSSSRPSGDPQRIVDWMKDWISYAQWLEKELAQEKRDHKDL